MPNVCKTAACEDSRRSARKRDEILCHRLAIEDLHLEPGRSVNKLSVGPGAVLFNHAVGGIISQAYPVKCDSVAVGVPRIGVVAVVGYVAVGVVGRGESRNVGHLVCRGRIGRLEAVGATGFINIPERIISERLPRSAGAVGAGDARKVIVRIIAGLVVGGIEGVGDTQATEGRVGIPVQCAGVGLAIHRELVLGHAARLRIVRIGVAVAPVEVHLGWLACRVVRSAGHRVA